MVIKTTGYRAGTYSFS